MADEGSKPTADWFSEDELVDCPRCGKHTAVTTPAGNTVCLECGYTQTAPPPDNPDK
jgi:hypothetical protein